MNRKIYLFLFVIVLGITSANAQEVVTSYGSSSSSTFNQLFTFAWDVNIPTGNKFIDEVSYSGGKLEYRKAFGNNLSIGFDLSWNSFYEYKPYQTYQLNERTDITTDLYKYNYTLPMAVTVHKYFPTSGLFMPYLGLGLGATYGSPSLIFNIYELNYYNWGFLMRPELGTVIKFGPTSDVGALVAARYSFSTNQETALRIDNLESVGFQLGIVWLY